MAKGTYGAYQRLTPIQQDYGRNSDQQLAKFGMLKGQQDAQTQAEQIRQEQLAASYAEDMSGINMDFTGIKSVDQINMDFVNTSKQQLGNMYRQMRENPGLASDPNFMLKMANLKNGAKLIAQAQGPVTKYATQLGEGMQDGTLSDANQQQLDEMEAIFGIRNEDGTYSPNYRIVHDEQGMPMMIGKTKDGRIFRKSVADMANGLQFGNPIKRMDYDDYITTKSKTLGARIKSGHYQGLTTTQQKFEYIEPEVRKGLEADLGTADNPSDMAKSMWVDQLGRDLNELDANAIEEMKDTIVNSLRMGYKESTTMSGRRITPGQEGQKEIPKGQIDPSSITLMTNSVGEPALDKSLGFGGAHGFSLPQALDLGLNNDRKQINSVYLDQAGNVYIKGQDSVRDEDSTFSAYNTEPYQRNSKEHLQEVTAFARKMGFPNVSSLAKYLRNQISQTQRQPSPASLDPNSSAFSQGFWEK